MAKYTAPDIILSGTFEVDQLLEFNLTAAVNQHAILQYIGIVDGLAAIEMVEKQISGQKMKVEIDGSLIFCGPVLSVTVSEQNNLTYLSVVCRDNSHLIDLDPLRRSFQNVHMKYAAMLEQIYAEADNASVITVRGTDREIEKPLLQYNETDWAYTIRMAGHLGTVVVPNLTAQNAQVSFGMPKGKNYRINTTEYLVERRGLSYIRKDRDYPDTHYADFLQYSTKDDRVFALGDKINIQGNTISVVELTLQLTNGMLENNYTLGSERAFCVKYHLNEKQAGLCLEGRVLDTREEVLKLHLDIDQKQDKSTAFEFEYSPQTNNGMYCMPQIGTKAMLRWKSAQDGDAVAIHCVRTNGQTCGELQNYHKRYFTTEFGKRLAMFPEVLYFKGGTNAVREEDDSGFKIKTEKKILIKAEGLIRIHSKKKVVFDTPEQLKATKTGVISGIDVSGGQMHFKSSKVIVHGNLGKPKVAPKQAQRILPITINAKLAAATAGMVPVSGVAMAK